MLYMKTPEITARILHQICAVRLLAAVIHAAATRALTVIMKCSRQYTFTSASKAIHQNCMSAIFCTISYPGCFYPFHHLKNIILLSGKPCGNLVSSY